MPKSYTSRLIRILLIFGCLLALNAFVIKAQDAGSPTDTPTDTPIEIPTDIPTDLPSEVPTDVVVPTDIPAPTDVPTVEAPTETPIPTEEATVVETEPVATVTDVPTVEPQVPQLPEEPVLNILVRETFDNGDLSPWNAEGWSLIPDANGLVMTVSNSNQPAYLLKGEFSNVAVKATFKWDAGSVQLNVRQSAVGAYTASLAADGTVQLTRAGEVLGAAVAPPAAADGWRSLRLSAIDTVIRVEVDGVEVIAVQDAFLMPPGQVSMAGNFPANEDGTVSGTLEADNFFLWVPQAEYGQYPAPTAVPTIEPVVLPTEEPTAEPTQEVTVVPTEETTPLPSGKASGEVAPPSPQQLAHAEASGNDLFANAVTITDIYPGNQDSGDTTAATEEANEPNVAPLTIAGCGVNVGRTAWFNFTPTSTGNYTISLAGSNFDTVLAVYTGATFATPLTKVACNDDASTKTLTSSVTFNGVNGTTYHIQIGGYQKAFGLYNISVQKVGVIVPKAPVLTNPPTGSTLADLRPDFSWLTTLNATHYEIQISTNSKFTTLVFNPAPIGTATTNTPSADLSENVLYYWRVRGINSNGMFGAYSGARTFTIKLSPPALDKPLAGSVVTTARPSFVVKPYGAGANNYHIQLSDTNTFPGDVDFTFDKTATTIPAIASLHQGTWYWRLGVTDVMTNNTTFGPSRSFIVDLKKAPTPDKIFPTAGTANVVFSWYAATGATTYTVDVATDDGFGTIVGSCTPVPSTALTCTVSNLNPGSYSWRVVSSFDTTPALVPPGHFTVGPTAPVAPVLGNPAANITIASQTPTFDWTAAVGTVGTPYTYELQYATNATFTTDLVTVPVSGITHTPGSNLDAGPGGAGKKYYWRVRTINNIGGPSAYTAARSFTIRTAGPTLKLPADGATTTNTKQPFSWLAYPGAEYHIQIDDDPGFGTPIADPSGLAGLTFTPATALPQGTYYWHVSAEDVQNTESDFSPSRSLIVNIQTSPADHANFVAASAANVTFKWALVAGATGYTLQIDDDSAFGSPIVLAPATITTTSRLVTGIGPGTWYWRVIAEGVDTALPPEIVRTFAVTAAVPAAPKLVSPPNNSTIWTTTPTLSWNATTTLTGSPFTYDLLICGNAACTTGVDSHPGIGTSFPATLSLGTYYWKVRTVNTNGALGNYSAPFKFTITNPPKPVLSAPANGSTITLSQPNFTWKKPLGAVTYNIYYDNFNPPTSQHNSTPITALSFKPSAPLLNDTYSWQIRAYDALGTPSVLSDVWSVKITTPTSGAPLANRFAPDNPAGYQIPKLTWGPITWTNGGGWYEIQVDDSSNFALPILFETPHNASVLPSGTQSLTQGVGGFPVLPNGVYFWRVRACDATPAHTCGAWSTVGSFSQDQ